MNLSPVNLSPLLAISTHVLAWHHAIKLSYKKSKDILVKLRGVEGASLVAQLIKNLPAM